MINLRSVATATLGLGAAAEALRFTPRRDSRLPVVAALWTTHVLSAFAVAMRSPRLPLPRMARRVGLAMMGAGGAFALYSAVVEHTREGRGRSDDADHSPSLADVLQMKEQAVESLEEPPRDGTYLASRHPALIGYAVFLAGLTLATRSLRLAISLPLWIAAAVGQAALREEALRRHYEWYDEYARTTPMLLPTQESARAAVEDLRARFAPQSNGHRTYPSAEER